MNAETNLRRDEVAQAVLNAYRWILGREADPGGLDHHVERIASGSLDLGGLRTEFMNSAEFRGSGAALGRFTYETAIPVETLCAPNDREVMLRRVSQSWAELGREKPHWSVITGAEFEPERAAQNIAEFYASGEDQVRRIEAALLRNGIDTAKIDYVLDYGCGLGRITNALAGKFGRAIGLDISLPHVDLARQSAATGAVFHTIASPQEIDAQPKVDLVVSIIVLQHNPPPVALDILTRLLGRLKEQGCAVFQIPTFIEGYRFEIEAYLAAETPLMEMHAVPQREVFSTIKNAGCVVLEVREDLSIADMPAVSQTFVVQRL